jgi:hypothetical protein
VPQGIRLQLVKEGFVEKMPFQERANGEERVGHGDVRKEWWAM